MLISAWITHGCEQRDISRFINSSNANWKPPYAINGTCGGVRGGESPLLDLQVNDCIIKKKACQSRGDLVELRTAFSPGGIQVPHEPPGRGLSGGAKTINLNTL